MASTVNHTQRLSNVISEISSVALTIKDYESEKLTRYFLTT